MRGTSRNLATLGGGEVWRSEVKPQSELSEEIQKTRLKDMVSKETQVCDWSLHGSKKPAVDVEYQVGAGSLFGVGNVM